MKWGVGMRRKVIVSISMLVLVGFVLFNFFNGSQLEINVTDEPIIIDQQNKEMTPEMLEEFLEIRNGETVIPLEEGLEILDPINLKDLGEYQVDVKASYKNRSSHKELTITVVDREPPKLIINDEEMLVYKGEKVKLSPDYFFINAYDGINGLINDRVEFKGKVDFNKVGKYDVEIIAKDKSGNETQEDLTIRVTDNIDEMAKYLYDRSIKFFHGDYFVHKDLDKEQPILNFEQGSVLLSERQLSHFAWLSGLNGEYNPVQSGIELSYDENDNLFGDTSKHKHSERYKETKLDLVNEDSGYRHYNAVSFYEEKNKDNKTEKDKSGYKRKFVVVNVDGQWLVDEFYLPY